MKLELKHLAPYLPYNPKVLNGYGDISDLKTAFIKYPRLFLNSNKIYNMALILRPLSDLTDRINPIQHHTYLDGLNHNSIEKIQDLITKGTLCLEDYNYLIENHFDVFGLIEKNLAININVLNI